MSSIPDLVFLFCLFTPEVENPKEIREVSVERFYLCLVILRSMRVTHVRFCLRVIVYEKHLNIEKTTSSVLFVILNNL